MPVRIFATARTEGPRGVGLLSVHFNLDALA